MAGPRIVVDVHEQRSGIPELLEELGAIVELAQLPAGDYALGENTLVERKRVLDLHSSILRRHLWGQLARLRAACAFPYLLVEGTDLDRGPLSPNAVRGACLAAVDKGIALLRSDHQRDSALWLHRLAVRCQRSEAEPARPERARTLDERRLALVPGISAASARALIGRFGSLETLAQAGPEQWVGVPGIGPGRARALSEALAQKD